MGKSKMIHLMKSNEEGFIWEVIVQITLNQEKWSGYFYLAGERRQRKSKTIQLMGTTEEGWGWQLRSEISPAGGISKAIFCINDEIRNYRKWRRTNDRYWAKITFPQRWLQQYEIHHSWKENETCFFLTPAEHRERDREIRYAAP
jgi:hypothetical protein